MSRFASHAAAALASLVLPVAALASTGGEHHEADLGTQLMLLAFSFVNFFIFVYLFRRFASAPLRDFLARRRTELAEAIEAAGKAKAEADALKAEYEAKVAKLEDTKRELIEEIRGIAEAEHQRTLESAREAAQRMRDEAQRTAQSDLERARRELRTEAARLATQLASQMITQRLDDTERQRLLNEFIERVRAS
jgi:F-type H+-transporting ATPase subunit b